MKKALRLALEELQIARDRLEDEYHVPLGWSVLRLDEVIEATKQALAQPEQEPLTDEELRQIWYDDAPVEGGTYIDMSKEALKLALEALEFFKGLALSMEEIERAEEAIDVLKQALAAPVQEPVAWPVGSAEYPRSGEHIFYTAPPAQPERQPLIPTSLAEQQFERYYRQGYDAGFAAQRQWVGLTDEEIQTTLSQLYCDINQMKFASNNRPQKETVGFLFAKAIEAKLKEKNT